MHPRNAARAVALAEGGTGEGSDVARVAVNKEDAVLVGAHLGECCRVPMRDEQRVVWRVHRSRQCASQRGLEGRLPLDRLSRGECVRDGPRHGRLGGGLGLGASVRVRRPGRHFGAVRRRLAVSAAVDEDDHCLAAAVDGFGKALGVGNRVGEAIEVGRVIAQKGLGGRDRLLVPARLQKPQAPSPEPRVGQERGEPQP